MFKVRLRLKLMPKPRLKGLGLGLGLTLYEHYKFTLITLNFYMLHVACYLPRSTV